METVALGCARPVSLEERPLLASNIEHYLRTMREEHDELIAKLRERSARIRELEELSTPVDVPMWCDNCGQFMGPLT